MNGELISSIAAKDKVDAVRVKMNTAREDWKNMMSSLHNRETSLQVSTWTSVVTDQSLLLKSVLTPFKSWRHRKGRLHNLKKLECVKCSLCQRGHLISFPISYIMMLLYIVCFRTFCPRWKILRRVLSLFRSVWTSQSWLFRRAAHGFMISQPRSKSFTSYRY